MSSLLTIHLYLIVNNDFIQYIQRIPTHVVASNNVCVANVQGQHYECVVYNVISVQFMRIPAKVTPSDKIMMCIKHFSSSETTHLIFLTGLFFTLPQRTVEH